MIYLDNAATTLVKPPEVAQAVVYALQHFGGVGRGAHASALSADTAVYQTRSAIARLLGAPSASRVAFASNATEALNTAILGLVSPGDHVVTTAASHNSVLRPLYRLRDAGIATLSIVPIGADGSLDYDELESLCLPATSLVVTTHASNVTGDVYDIERIAAIAHNHGAVCVVDAAQTAGTWPIDMTRQGLDVVAFTGHKALFGPQGTGGLCVAEGIEVDPLKVGGSGVLSFDESHPSRMPERLEAGTLNAHGIAGLGAGVSFILSIGVEHIRQHEQRLVELFLEGVSQLRGVTALGGGSDGRCGIVSLVLDGIDSSEAAFRLDSRYGICTRAGAHCAPLMHKALGTEHTGAVRFSFSCFTTEEEVHAAIAALHDIADLGR